MREHGVDCGEQKRGVEESWVLPDAQWERQQGYRVEEKLGERVGEVVVPWRYPPF